VEKAQAEDLSQISNEELNQYLVQLYKLGNNICSWGYFPMVLEVGTEFFTDYLKESIEEHKKPKKLTHSVERYFQVLTHPLEKTFTQKGFEGLIAIAQKIENDKELSQVKNLEENEQVKQWVEEHEKKFNWVNYGHEGPAFTKKYFFDELKAILEEKTENVLNIMKQEEADVKKRQQEYLGKLEFDEETSYLFETAQKFSFLKVYRKELLHLIYFNLDRLLKEVSRRSGLSLKQLRYCEREEVTAILLENKIPDTKLLNERSDYCLEILDGEKTSLKYGEEAKKHLKENVEAKELVKEDVLKGTCACPGEVIGEVKIINRVEDMAKMEEGNILVSVATSPELLPAMKKAAAFVTDLGGLTCHAAIVSRELKMPCVIGTKNATHALKDGDKVKVDATHGIVRKL
jgi:phosphoenolpyruvate synthase/pyruvate phosphate dikinase